MENQAAVATPTAKKPHLFSIKPYGDFLCTPGASYWIACIRLVIIVMALSEAIAWGYLGSLFGRGPVGYIAAGIAFLFVFIIIWIIDVSFVTLDLSRAHYDRAIMRKKVSTWVDNTKISIGLLGRVAIVVVSLSISAPFIAQIVFMQDIDNEMERQNLARVDAMSDSLLAARDVEVAALDSLILEKEAELVTETAGQGASGNYGFGPVTQAMERNIQRLKDERMAKIEEKDELEESFRTLSTVEFARQYNVDLVDNGVQARSAILSSLAENPEYKTAKRAITAFLAFIFAALVLLKLFQPRSVKIYYNEKLQDLYKEYLTGNLNKWISKEEQYPGEGPSRMSPLRFEDWAINTYGVIRSEDIKRRESRKVYNAFRMKIDQLEAERIEVKHMLEPVENEYNERVGELNQMRVELMESENAIEQNERIRSDIERQVRGIDNDLKNGRFRGEDLLHAVQAKKNIEDRLSAHKADRLQLEHNRDIARHRYETKQKEVDQLHELITKLRSNHNQIQEKIDEERLGYTDMIVSGQLIGVGAVATAAALTAAPAQLTEEPEPVTDGTPEVIEVEPVIDPLPQEFANEDAEDLDNAIAEETENQRDDDSEADTFLVESADQLEAEPVHDPFHEEPAFSEDLPVVDPFEQEHDETSDDRSLVIDYPYDHDGQLQQSEDKPEDADLRGGTDDLEPVPEEETDQKESTSQEETQQYVQEFLWDNADDWERDNDRDETENTESIEEADYPEAQEVPYDEFEPVEEDYDVSDVDQEDDLEDDLEDELDYEESYDEDGDDFETVEPVYDEPAYARVDDANFEELDYSVPEAEEQDFIELDTEGEELEEDEAKRVESYASYPLLLNGSKEVESDPEEPVDYVNDSQLEMYADAASLANYEEQGGEEEEPELTEMSEAINWNLQDTEFVEDNEEEKSEKNEEDLSQEERFLEPEAADEADLSEYTVKEDAGEDDDGSIEESEEASPKRINDLFEPKPTIYDWTSLEPTNPTEQESRDETVEERAEATDQPEDAIDSGEKSNDEDVFPDGKSEDSGRDQGRTRSRRALKPRRNLGVTGDWMIG